MQKPLISVIIPCFNSAEYLPEALESVMAQTCANVEIIVINDGSTDNTDEMVQSYADKIIYIKQQNAGPAVARNRGLSIAQGEYIAFLDADDIWEPDKLEKQLSAIECDHEIGLVYTKYANFNSSNDKVTILPNEVFSGSIFDKILNHNVILLSTVMVKTNILKDLNGFDKTLHTAEDTNLWLRIARKYKILGLDDVLLQRRMHHDNLSSRTDIPVGTLENLDRIVALFPDTDPDLYPPMREAYQLRGQAMMQDYFHAAQYRKCHDAGTKLIGRKITNASILLFWFLTLFPDTMINFARSTNRKIG